MEMSRYSVFVVLEMRGRKEVLSCWFGIMIRTLRVLRWLSSWGCTRE